MELVDWFEQLGRGDVGLDGTGGANVGALTAVRVPEISAYVETSAEYRCAEPGAGIEGPWAAVLNNGTGEYPADLTRTADGAPYRTIHHEPTVPAGRASRPGALRPTRRDVEDRAR